MSRSRQEILTQLALVGRAHSDATVLFHATVAEQLALHPTDYKVLGILMQKGPLSAGEIATFTGLKAASITNLIDRLEAKELAKRVHDTDDRRRILVHAEHGKLTRHAQTFAPAVTSLTKLYERYSLVELETIADFLKRNAERLQEETAALVQDRA